MAVTTEIITIGNELIYGLIENTNAVDLSRSLQREGVLTRKIQTVGDDAGHIGRALDQIDPGTDLVLITGGLGPTHDDITMDAAAKFFGSELTFNPRVFAHLKAFLRKRKPKMVFKDKSLAYFPTRAEIILNPLGSAVGMKFVRQKTRYYFMPGVPQEMQAMVATTILPEIRALSTPVFRTTTLHTLGITEAALYKKLKPWMARNNALQVSFLPQSPGVDISLLSKTGISATRFSALVRGLTGLLGDYHYGNNDDSLERVTARLLVKNELTIGVAESCTAGYISHCLTNVPGSSDYFIGGAVTYSNQSKVDLLGIQPETLTRYGAVSQETAAEMARGIKERCHCEVGLSSTGIAGPTGGSLSKPVGTVFIGIDVQNIIKTHKFIFNKDRLTNKLAFSKFALNQLRLYLQDIKDKK